MRREVRVEHGRRVLLGLVLGVHGEDDGTDGVLSIGFAAEAQFAKNALHPAPILDDVVVRDCPELCSEQTLAAMRVPCRKQGVPELEVARGSILDQMLGDAGEEAVILLLQGAHGQLDQLRVENFAISQGGTRPGRDSFPAFDANGDVVDAQRLAYGGFVLESLTLPERVQVALDVDVTMTAAGTRVLVRHRSNPERGAGNAKKNAPIRTSGLYCATEGTPWRG